MLINLILQCGLMFIDVSLAEYNFVSLDRVHGLSTSGQQMWPLPFN